MTISLQHYFTIVRFTIVQYLLKIRVSNQPADITTFRAAIAAKILSCITTFHYNTTTNVTVVI